MSARSSAVRHVNASALRQIGESRLLDLWRGCCPPLEWQHHLHVLFDKTDVETLSDIVRSGAVSYAQLSQGAAEHLPADHDIRRWLDARA